MAFSLGRVGTAIGTGGLSELGGLLGGSPQTLQTSGTSNQNINQTTTGQALPNQYVLPAYQNLLGMGQNLALNPNASANYLNTAQAAGIQGIQNAVNNPQGLLAQGTQGMQDTISGKYLSPESNPYLQGVINNALGQVRGSLGSTFAGQNFGSSAHEQMLNRQSMQAIAPILAQNYATERQNQLGAIQNAPAYGMYGANALLGAGNAQQQAAGNQLGLLQGTVGTGLQGGLSTTGTTQGTTTGQTTGTVPNPNYQTTGQQLLGLGATLGGAYLGGPMGASAGSQLTNTGGMQGGGMFNPLGG